MQSLAEEECFKNNNEYDSIYLFERKYTKNYLMQNLKIDKIESWLMNEELD